ncbi:MAG TPA: hypothetical protein VFP60_05100 [Pseudolabrys sp.]|nr:hypothetical protein [Pseudolabrys sp.]
MGNRGGRLHDLGCRLSDRRWVTRAWICCKLEFNGRHRQVWGRGYTELFFLDEVTALAAGHRPCFECRHKDAEHFAALFSGEAHRAWAAGMDEVLHIERLAGKLKRTHRSRVDALPDGAMIALEGTAYAVLCKRLLRWTPAGYSMVNRNPETGVVDVLTPPSILRVLERGYVPLWHHSAMS